MDLSPIIRDGRLSSTKAWSSCPSRSIRQRCLKRCLRAADGEALEEWDLRLCRCHSRIHEVLGIARGSGRVQFGGSKGRALELKAGDVAILPAGVGPQMPRGKQRLLVVAPIPARRLRRV